MFVKFPAGFIFILFKLGQYAGEGKAEMVAGLWEEGSVYRFVCWVCCVINKHLITIITIEITRGRSGCDQSALSSCQHVLPTASLLLHLSEKDW